MRPGLLKTQQLAAGTSLRWQAAEHQATAQQQVPGWRQLDRACDQRRIWNQ